MAKKSKTQKAKASAARQARKAEKKRQELEGVSEDAKTVNASEEKPAAKDSGSKKSIFKKSSSSESSSTSDSSSKKKSSSNTKIEKKSRFQFFKDVRSEMKRVTWPTRMDVLRWSGVVVCALVFFGIFTAVLDNLIVTPLLYLISGVDPTSVDASGMIDSSAAVDAGTDGAAVDVSDGGTVDTGTDSVEVEQTGAETETSGDATESGE